MLFSKLLERHRKLYFHPKRISSHSCSQKMNCTRSLSRVRVLHAASVWIYFVSTFEIDRNIHLFLSLWRFYTAIIEKLTRVHVTIPTIRFSRTLLRTCHFNDPDKIATTHLNFYHRFTIIYLLYTDTSILFVALTRCNDSNSKVCSEAVSNPWKSATLFLLNSSFCVSLCLSLHFFYILSSTGCFFL